MRKATKFIVLMAYFYLALLTKLVVLVSQHIRPKILCKLFLYKILLYKDHVYFTIQHLVKTFFQKSLCLTYNFDCTTPGPFYFWCRIRCLGVLQTWNCQAYPTWGSWVNDFLESWNTSKVTLTQIHNCVLGLPGFSNNVFKPYSEYLSHLFAYTN